MNTTDQYWRDGYLSPVDILDSNDARQHRTAMEDAERQLGESLHYKSKVHTILTSPLALVTHPALLDQVEQIIGPDILLYDATFITKEAGAASHVSWHQDLTYWGLDSDNDQVSAWLALSEANDLSGCMRMIPGSHANGLIPHEPRPDDTSNVLLQAQTVSNVDESLATFCPLRPGQASLHHGWTLHASMPNRSNDRRIGLNMQFIAPHVRQTKLPGFTALLVRGEDRFNHYPQDIPASSDLDPAAMKRRDELHNLYIDIAGQT